MSTITHQYSVESVDFRPLETPIGNLNPVLVSWPDAHQTYHFVEPGSDALAGFTPDNTTPRVVARDSLFLGEYVPADMRGAALGRQMLGWFCEYGDERKTPVVRTGVIRKPMVAKILRGEGFTPQTLSAVAELLPQPISEAGEPPVIRWLYKTLPDDRAPAESPDGRLYYAVRGTDPGAQMRTPRNEANVVALHTPYTRPVPSSKPAKR